MSNRFLRFLLMSINSSGGFKVGGTTRDSLNIRDIRSLECPMPTMTEQHEIVQILEEQFSRLEAFVDAADEADKKIGALRHSLLYAAFSGELTKEWREKNNG
jgi:type I restriction enzyme S subunit